jgi:hypothetical protein
MANILAKNDDGCRNDQFMLDVNLYVNTTYVLVVTTAYPNIKGNLSVIVYSSNNVAFNRISKYLLLITPYTTYKMLLRSIVNLNVQEG